jgi:conjugative transfer signal peptidase TraF
LVRTGTAEWKVSPIRRQATIKGADICRSRHHGIRFRKVRTKRGNRNLIISARKEGHGAVEVTDPDLGAASVEAEGAFFIDLGCGVGWGENLDAAKMSMKSPRKRRGKGSRTLAISCLGGLALLWAVCQAGLRINGTNSEPVGIYWAISKPLARGDLVFVLPPASPMFKLAKERGYLAVGPSPAGTCGLIKQVAAVCGDRVTIDSTAVRVNGIRLKNSAPRAADDAGRPMRTYELRDYALGSGEVILMSDYNPASFDGRYFGPLCKTTIQSVIVPVLTWK